MKKFLIEEEEKKSILSMHKSLMVEIQNLAAEDPNLQKLRAAVNSGCLTNGKIFKLTSRNVYVYKKPSKQSGKMVYFLPDMTYEFLDGSKKGKWKCPQLSSIVQTKTDTQAKIATELKKGWKTLDTLRSEGVDLNTLDKVFDIENIDGTNLYRPKTNSENVSLGVSTPEMEQQKKAFIDSWEAKGYKMNPTPIEKQSLSKKEIQTPPGLFPSGLIMWYDPNSQSSLNRSSRPLQDILGNQQVQRGACRRNIKDFYMSFKNNSTINDASFDDAKRIVQACANQHKGQWGIAGEGNKLDRYIDILSGVVDGGPSSYGADSKWRIQPVR